MICFRLLDAEEPAQPLAEAVRMLNQGSSNASTYVADPASFRHIPNAPFAYWVSDKIRKLFVDLPAFKNEERTAKQGLATADDFRFVRTSWETPIDQNEQHSRRWYHFAKGGSYSPFYADIYLKVNWGEDGFEIKFLGDPQGIKPSSRPQSTSYYFRPGLTWPRRTNGLSFRVLPTDCVFADKGPAVIVHKNEPDQLLAILAQTNSTAFLLFVTTQLARVELAQSFEVGLIKNTPLARSFPASLPALARQAWVTKRSTDLKELTSHAFFAPVCHSVHSSLTLASEAWSSHLNQSTQTLQRIQEEINEITYGLYGIGASDRQAIEEIIATDSSSDEISVNAAASVAELMDYSTGATLGRWDILCATRENQTPAEPEPFDALPLCSPGTLQNASGLPATPKDVPADYPIDIPWHGILVSDADHELSITRRVCHSLSVIWQDKADTIEQEACDILNIKKLSDYFTENKSGSNFFKDHLKRYSKSKRKAPIYWPISTESGTYTLWFYYHRLSEDTLYTAVTQFIEPKQEDAAKTFADLNAKPNRSKEEDKELEAAQLLVAELATLRESLLEIAKFWKPNLNDGVQITAAPLHKHFRFTSWRNTLKTTWTKLEKGEFDWAHLAHTVWPDRVIRKCLTDRSLAIAHGHDEALWETYQDDRNKTKYRLKKDAKETVEKLIEQQSN